MAILSTMGIKALYYAPVNSSDRTQMPTSGYKAVDVYQDTCTFVDKDPTVTTHKSETSKKKIVQKTKEGNELKFSIMDPSLEQQRDFEGGELSGTANQRTYKDPDTAMDIEFAFKVLPQAGLALNIPCGSVVAKRNTTYSSKGITLLEITVEPTNGIEYSEVVTAPTLAAETV